VTHTILASNLSRPQQCRPRGRRCPFHYGRDDDHGAVRGFRSVRWEQPPVSAHPTSRRRCPMSLKVYRWMARATSSTSSV